MTRELKRLGGHISLCLLSNSRFRKYIFERENNLCGKGLNPFHSSSVWIQSCPPTSIFKKWKYGNRVIFLSAVCTSNPMSWKVFKSYPCFILEKFIFPRNLSVQKQMFKSRQKDLLASKCLQLGTGRDYQSAFEFLVPPSSILLRKHHLNENGPL